MTNIFITGFPGFIGNRLVQYFVQHQPEMYLTLLVHPKMSPMAHEIAVQSQWPSNRYQLIEGDITKQDLGLSEPQRATIKDSIEIVYHLAAIYDLTVSKNIAENINVSGTQHVLDFFNPSKHLKHLNYISTCYVAGKRTGMITAQDLSSEYGFYNFYESTKYDAEKLVQKKFNQLPITIFRPAIVVGDSQTGETEKFDGPYVIMDFLDTIKFFLRLIPNLGFSECEANTVPVDYVIGVLAYLGTKDISIGKVYQICDPNPPTTQDFFSYLVKLIAGVTPYSCSPLKKFILKILPVWPIPKITGISKQHLDYFAHPGKFRDPHLKEALANAPVQLRHYQSYYPQLYKYLKIKKGSIGLRPRDDNRFVQQ